jgi:heme-degrading monooxygenase HmoA
MVIHFLKGGMIMFARFTIVQVNAEKIDETIKLYEESVVPTAKSQKGFRGITLFTDRQSGKGYSISIWDSEEDAVANEQSGYYKEQVGKFAEFMTAPPVQESYEVVVQG